MDQAHHMVVRELDLSACHPHSVADKFHAVPGLAGLKNSAAFFSFLRANLVLDSTALTSHANTPMMQPLTSSSSSFSPSSSSSAPPSPSLSSNASLVSDDDIPDFSLETLKSPEDKEDGLHLVADSIAQMRQQASRALIFHPVPLVSLGIALSVIFRLTSHDPGSALVLCGGAIMSFLAAVRWRANGYLSLAEALRWDWLLDHNGDEDLVLGARYDDELIGTLVLRLKPSPTGGKRKSRNVSLKGGSGVIRAWTTSLKHRNRGVGRDLLVAAVRVTKERCGKDAPVGFAKEHANSTMLLPSMFNRSFRKDEFNATLALDDAIAEWEACRKRR